jgi:hypothetical protein
LVRSAQLTTVTSSIRTVRGRGGRVGRVEQRVVNVRQNPALGGPGGDRGLLPDRTAVSTLFSEMAPSACKAHSSLRYRANLT